MTSTDSSSRVSSGSPEPRGVTLVGDGVNVAVYSAHADTIEFCLFDAGDAEIARLPLTERTGNVFHAHIAGVEIGARYGLRAHGPYDPHAGHRFNAAKLLVDPYALALDRPFVIDPLVFGFVPGTGQPDPADSAAVVPKAVVAAPARAEPWSHAVDWEHVVIAEIHVRGFTKLHPGVPEPQRGTFAGLAAPVIIDHLKRMGVTTVELLPAAASMDERHLKPLGLTNYWNYNPVAFLAPDPRLAPGGWEEIRAATAALNAAGIEVILDVVYNHSGEGDELGPTVSMRGLDNAGYYRLDPGDRARYINDAGCGNILAADQTEVVRLVMDSLRAWAQFGGMNGFRFDLATTLGRRFSGFEANAPLLAAIEQDPVLRNLRLIAEPWDIGPGGYQVGAFSARWGEWNDKYRDEVRRFWRGDGSIADLATRISGSADLFWPKRKPSRGINFVTAHDGFTLADLVSYAQKHNEANGEQNRDGTNANYSWNNGVEGPTADPKVLDLRRRDQRNLLATLLLSRGTPMLGPGSETGHSQGGNNNAYAQDNPISWTDWSQADDGLTGFIASLIAIRSANPALTRDVFLIGSDRDGSGFLDVAWRLPNGEPPQGGAWHDPSIMTLVAVLSAARPDRPDQVNRVTVVFHTGWSDISVALPEVRPGHVWRLALDTASSGSPADQTFAGEAIMTVTARMVAVLVEEEGNPPPGRRRVAPDVLERLSQAAGIAPEWWDIHGARHEVGPDTKRALLASMGLPVGSTGEAHDRLDELTSWRDRRALPRTLAARENMSVPLRLAVGTSPKRLRLTIEREDGSTAHENVDVDATMRVAYTAVDGRPVEHHRVTLPPQPAGRHRIRLDTDPDAACTLTVAPARCFLPDDLTEGGKAFGVAAHLYSLRGARDSGIGDFSVLAEFAEGAARQGARLIGINPIHTLFARDRGRTSPYHPSDRRFLDPIYLDIGGADIVGEAAEVQAVLDRQAEAITGFRKQRYVDYPGVWKAKHAVLEAAFLAFDERCRRQPGDADVLAFTRFVAEGGRALHRFGVFEALSEHAPDRPWTEWPQELRSPDKAAVAAFAEAQAARVRFHIYLQWLCDNQLSAAVQKGGAAGLSIGLYRDLAVGTAPDGGEAWAEQDAYASGASVGSPPDPFSATGQIWCLPPPNPVARDRTGAGLFGQLLDANMRHAGALRIDHAMGLSRLFWVPDGAPGSAGAYVSYDFEANLTDVALASQQARCLVIGEDLGTVQEGFRERLAANDILSYRVLFFEREGLGFKQPAAYPTKALACVATHDLPTLAGWWAGRDIDERQHVGQIDGKDVEHLRQERTIERQKLAEVARIPALPEASADAFETVSRAVHGFLAETPSLVVMAQAEDLVGETECLNLPGTDKERPNWRRRLEGDTAALCEQADQQGLLPRRP